MRMSIGFCVLWLTLLAKVSAEHYKIFCYYTSWSAYRPGSGEFQISDINTTLCTHLIYAFVGITAEGNISVLDPWQDLPDDGGKNGFGRFNALKENKTNLKTMVSIGGWTQGSANFSVVVNDPDLRATFVQNAVDFLSHYGFNGLDVNWEYPAQRGGIASDVPNFVLLLKELHEALETCGFLLTTAVAASQSAAETSYDIPGIAAAVDYINLITYEYHSTADNVTGHNTPLYAAERETTAEERLLNIYSSVSYWIAQGALPSKLTLGIAAYGKSFTLNNSCENTPGSAVSGAGDAGAYTREAGTLAYYEICQSNWTVVYDEEQRVPYAYSGDQWVSYDDTRSIKEKANYLKIMGLAGAMIWSLDLDDFNAICGVRYPILTTLNDTLHEDIS